MGRPCPKDDLCLNWTTYEEANDAWVCGGHGNTIRSRPANGGIGYDALNTYGGVSYHVLKLCGNNKGDTILPPEVRNMPTWEAPMRGPGCASTKLHGCLNPP